MCHDNYAGGTAPSADPVEGAKREKNMKNTFVMYTDWIDMIEDLTDEDRGLLFLAIMRYQLGEELPEMKKGSGPSVAFAQMRRQFEKDSEKYNELCQKRREAGKTGGRPKSEKKEEVSEKSKWFSQKANESKPKQKNPDNDNVNDNVLKENTLKGVKEKRFAPPTPENVSGYCREMGYTNVDAERFVDFYASKDWMVGKNKMKDWKAAVRNWARQDKTKAVEKTGAPNRFHNFVEREGVNYDAMMEAETLKWLEGMQQ